MVIMVTMIIMTRVMVVVLMMVMAGIRWGVGDGGLDGYHYYEDRTRMTMETILVYYNVGISVQVPDRFSCGSFCWSCCLKVVTPAALPGKGPTGNSRSYLNYFRYTFT